MARTSHDKGVSLAKGPVGLLGLAMIAWGVIHFLMGGNGFGTDPMSGTVNGDTFLGLEGNGWTNVLWVGAGLLLVFGAPMHWGAKSMALIVGLVLGAASIISMVDGNDVFGIFATNGPTQLALGAAATALIVLSLLPRVGKKKRHDRDADLDRERVVHREHRVVEREPRGERVVHADDRNGRFDREPARERIATHGTHSDDRLHGEPHDARYAADDTDRRTVAPADGDGISDHRGGTTRRDRL